MPLNTSERRSSFLVFLLFFVLSIGVVTLTAFYGVRIPTRQNEVMKAQIAALQNEKAFILAFTAKASETEKMLENVNATGVNSTLMDGRIQANLDTLSKMTADTTSDKKRFVSVFSALSALAQAKKDLRGIGAAGSQVQTLMQINKEQKQELDQCQANVAQLELAAKNGK